MSPSISRYIEPQPRRRPRDPRIVNLLRCDKPILCCAPIPSRIQKEVELCINDSETSHSDKGLFCMGDLRRGDTIFTIKRPLMTMVDISEKRDPMCDNCFLSASLVENGITLHLCAGCKRMRYCNAKCQRQAWYHHHKYECNTYATIDSLALTRPDVGKDMIVQHEVRYIVRLLQLHRHGVIGEGTETEWQEFERLPEGPRWRQSAALEAAKLNAQFLKGIIDTPFSEDEITRLTPTLHNTWRPMTGPRMVKRLRSYKPTLVVGNDAGFFVEPFIEIIQRSCEGNAWCVFSGNELHVRATKDIVAGTEITIRFPLALDYLHRTQLLKDYWDISCACSLCKDGPSGPSGAFREQIMGLIDLDINGKVARLPDIKRAIQGMDDAGFTNGAELRGSLHWAAFTAYLASNQTALALKECLKLRYVIEPNLKPPVRTVNRLTALFYLICLANPLLLDPHTDTVPLQVREVLCALRLHWRQVHMGYATQCFGVESREVSLEREVLLSCLQGARSGMDEDMGYPFMSMAHEGDRLKLVVLLNALLKWAGIPPMTEEQLIGPTRFTPLKERPVADLSMEELDLKALALTRLALNKMGLEGKGFDEQALQRLGLNNMEDIAHEMASKVIATDSISEERAKPADLKDMALNIARLGDIVLNETNLDDSDDDGEPFYERTSWTF